MRVLYSFPDEIGKPGIGSTASHQVQELAALGAEVTLYCTSSRAEFSDNVRVVPTLALGAKRIPHRLLGIDRSYRYHDIRVAAVLRRAGAAFDVVHCWPRATVRTSRAAEQVGIPSFREVPNTHTTHAIEVVAREVEALGLAPASYSHAFSPKTIALEELEYEVADVLLVPSEHSLHTFVERDVPRHKLVLHQYGCDTGRFFADTTPRPADRPFTALYVGRCEPRKGLHHALRAWHASGASREGRFVICGSFEPGYREVIEPLLSHPSVDVRGFVPDPSVLMRESDVFVLPSIEEGSALVTYEARASGCVLAVSEAAGARVENGRSGLVHALGDVATLTDHLQRLHQDPTLLAGLRAESLAHVEDLSWRRAGEELLKIYESQADTTQASVPALQETSMP